MSERYTRPAQYLHWLLALALVLAWGLGRYMVGLSFSPLQLKLLNWHKWLGIAIGALSLLRLLWRLSHRPPALPAALRQALPRWQSLAQQGVHMALYALSIGLPLLGWAHSSAKGFPVVLLGLWPLPDWVPVDAALAQGFKLAHRLAAWSLALLVGLHLLALIQHQWLGRHALLQRMRPW